MSHLPRSAAPFGAVTTFRMTSALMALAERGRAWRTAEATDRALRALSDRELADIGLHRGEIPDVAARFASRY